MPALTRRHLLFGLWAVAVALAIAVVLGATSVFDHKSDTRRSAVEAYITNVDGVQQQMRLRLTQLLSAYRDFSTTGTRAARAKLAAGEQTLRRLEQRLAALPAPADAAKLRRLLLELVRQEVAVAQELTTLARFTPRFQALLATAATAASKLGKDLAAAPSPKPQTVRGTAKQIAAAQAAYAAQAAEAANEQADAVDAYESTLGEVAASLRRLQPPAIMAPAYRAELRTLEATGKAGAALSAELRKPDRSRVPQLSRALTKAARLSGTVAAQNAEIAAVKAYNARVSQIGRPQAQVHAETVKLQRELG